MIILLLVNWLLPEIVGLALVYALLVWGSYIRRLVVEKGTTGDSLRYRVAVFIFSPECCLYIGGMIIKECLGDQFEQWQRA